MIIAEVLRSLKKFFSNDKFLTGALRKFLRFSTFNSNGKNYRPFGGYGMLTL